MSSQLDRRTFLRKMGIGATGAVLLGPIARTLVAQAQGAVPVRKTAVFLLASNGLPPSVLTPPDIPVGTGALLEGRRDFAWPAMLKPLEPHRSRTLLIDGLSNRVSGEHSGGFGALSAVNVTRGTGQDDGPPGAITIDQFIAGQIGRTTALKSLLWGVASGHDGLQAKIFAAGRERPLPHLLTVDGLWNRLFGSTGIASAEVARRRRLLLDPLRGEVNSLRSRLAPSERRSLDDYLEVVEDFETRLAAFKPTSCTAAAPNGGFTALEDRIEAMNELSILAVTCGLTNVVGISLGCGHGHAAPPFNKIHVGTPFESEGRMDYHGHDPTYEASMEIIFRYVAQVAARMVEAWSKVKEGDKTIFDNTVILMTSDNGEHHHSKKDRWPLVLVGNAGGVLNTGGRFLRYSVGSRALADLYSTIAHAVGAPTDKFGEGGSEPVKGPLSEVLA